MATKPAYMQIKDLSKYENLRSDNPVLQAQAIPLNFEKLLSSGAFRITHRGLDNGYDPDPTAGFSLVSAYNDAAGEQTRGWKDNPRAYDVVRSMFEKSPENIGAHKYLQIIQSARDLGLNDEDIFLQPNKAELPPEYGSGGRVSFI